ncbi:hypothetical protein ASC94_30830 [Massilia sp. Root418]|uniref:hypothetical protein n=1 Tax=Massilia sp. Root418 TaxID=1736532 RepID=UPI0006F969A7|nr:hypothetical protein [Massilia sp. Root418]KQW99930.1 hypothetical protein ASC94_30830 [Massilia sp. Root418]
MTHTLAAVFDTRKAAEQARTAVLAGGFREHTVQLSEETQAAAPDKDDDSIGSSIKRFFSNLFGDDDDKSDTYAEAVTRGHHVLTVQGDSLEEVERAADIIEAYGPVDIDERKNEWSSAGWSGARATGAASAGSQYAGAQQSAPAGGSSMGGTGLGGRSDLSGSPDLGATAAVGGATDLGATPTIGGMSGVGSTASMGSTSSMNAASGAGNTAGNTAGNVSGGSAGASQQRDAGSGLASPVIQDVLSVSTRSFQRGGVRIYERTVAGRLGAADLSDDYYRSHWDNNFSSAGGNYEEYEPAYRYGERMASADSLRGRSWDDAESGLRSSWESQYPQSAWDKFKSAIRHGWERLAS